ncbi:four helix bundle protein [Pontibacter burrus]|uniref:Four helix bundle protein n=1 Tax=Pontibacter burrus TaxID=2704466 RepID=A0A6B3LU97_9BACT|nr:four helix bundle protein [Pontibacter burrus]NEM99383.1 four helix bundle protein [Pontibacter burrus]
MEEYRLSNYAFSEQFKLRTKAFSVRIIKLFQALPKDAEAYILGKQLLRSATSVGANYRAACRARSKAEFVAKVGVSLEEADESQFWLELLVESNIVRSHRLQDIMKEASEIIAILTTIRKNASKK